MSAPAKRGRPSKPADARTIQFSIRVRHDEMRFLNMAADLGNTSICGYIQSLVRKDMQTRGERILRQFEELETLRTQFAQQEVSEP